MVRVLQKKKTSRRASLSRRASVQKEMPVTIGIHLSVLLGISEHSSTPKKLEGEPKKRHSSVAAATTVDITRAGEETVSLKFWRGETFCMVYQRFQ